MQPQKDPNKDAGDDVHFLIEKALTDASLFWTRTNAILAVEAAGLAGAATAVAADHRPHSAFILGISLIGFVFCGVWWQITRVSRY